MSHYEVTLTHSEVAEFRKNLREVIEGTFIGVCPEYNEQICWRNEYDHCKVIYELDEDDQRIIYQEVDHNPRQISKMMALVCAVTKSKRIKIGTSFHTVHVVINHPDYPYVAKTRMGVNVFHDRAGLVFIKEGRHYVQAMDNVIAEILNQRSDWAIPSLIPDEYLIRFRDPTNLYVYFSVGTAFLDPILREAAIDKKYWDLPWELTRQALEVFVDNYTKPSKC